MEVGYQEVGFNFSLKVLIEQKLRHLFANVLKLDSYALSMNIIVSDGNVTVVPPPPPFLATACEILVPSTQFSVTMMTRKVQLFWNLHCMYNCNDN